ncbi:MGH1-like glycoside hydrolase domain-containing protein [Paenibacillus koleovorans]|uniref:MGH1-like glycoside hydrolase domain-containing protein n=1 Tax=Paenibacillus koleovorans TaxID=121608 RepID=UPI0013E3AC44|nr:trehalase family glycosidase [Paenibacillus koleovorans]
MFDRMKQEARQLGKPEWAPMLHYTAELHERSTMPPAGPFEYPWEGIGTGYCYGPAFGHWDIVHSTLDAIPVEPEHARHQLLNLIRLQGANGLVPGVIWMSGEQVRFSMTIGHPPVWPFAVSDFCAAHGDNELIATCYEPLLRQISWFERERAADNGGFYYKDISTRRWESGVDDGVRFDNATVGLLACMDATSHVYALYACAAQWATILGRVQDGETFNKKAEALAGFIQQRLFDEETGFFHDSWAVGHPEVRHLSFEGMWPLVVGAATVAQAERVIEENLLAPDKFYSAHPLATVVPGDGKYELRMWRGPAWNSMTYWAARGCMLYRRHDAAKRLLEKALDATAAQFDRTGTIWEFYHPHGGEQTEVARKPYTEFNTPCRDYIGHNPLLAMARLWETAKRQLEEGILAFRRD